MVSRSAAIASGVGLLLGGALTEYADWRWCLLVNVPFALLAVVLAVPLVPESKAQGNTRYDVPGAVTATMGLVSLVYGFTQAAEPGKGWGSWEARGFIAAGLALLAIFVFIEMKSSHPLLPLRIQPGPGRCARGRPRRIACAASKIVAFSGKWRDPLPGRGPIPRNGDDRRRRLAREVSRSFAEGDV